MIPVILSGGVGSRLWPLSRGMYPKQLLPLVDPNYSMLQQTVQRTVGLHEISAPILVCNEEHRFMVGEQLQQVGVQDATIILEPEGRNTAPAIALAAFKLLQDGARDDADELMLVMPADHLVKEVEAFHQAVRLARELAQQDYLVTFGIVPQGPETGYGYIKGGPAGQSGGFAVAEFKEKPNFDTAEAYVSSGDYYWNGGIFLFKASVFLAELAKLQPDVYRAAELAMSAAEPDLDFIRIDKAAFTASPSISFDYAVMEHTDKAMVVPLDAGWSDVGSWSALWEAAPKDGSGNAISGDVLLHNTTGSHIYAETKLVSAIGVENLIIVETDDAVMVAPRDKAHEVKAMVKQLHQQDRTHTQHHRKVYRPWGWYDSIAEGADFKVKRIQVKPGARLSVQMHHKRAEHWVVVKGVAEVLNGDKTFELLVNQSTYIPVGVTHALRNPSEEEPLEIIEVQSGSYLGEDDIVRFEDDYGRS